MKFTSESPTALPRILHTGEDVAELDALIDAIVIVDMFSEMSGDSKGS